MFPRADGQVQWIAEQGLGELRLASWVHENMLPESDATTNVNRNSKSRAQFITCTHRLPPQVSQCFTQTGSGEHEEDGVPQRVPLELREPGVHHLR